VQLCLQDSGLHFADREDFLDLLLVEVGQTDGADFADFLSFCRAHPAGLVAPSAAELLETPQGRARLARRALRMYLATPVPPLFSPAEDPFGLLNGYVASLPSLYAGWSPREGFLVAPDATDTVVLVVLELAPAVLADTRKLVEFKQAFDALCAQIVHPPVSVVACGVPLHTATTAARCQREMGALTVFSVLFIAGLGFVVFKSFRWLPCVFLTLLCALLTGLAALLLCFASVHALTFVLGTTLLGLVVDYAFHRLLQPAQNAAAVAKGLCLSCLTTEISLLPLLFSAIPVLCQTAVFLGAGLGRSVAVFTLFGFLFVSAAGPDIIENYPDPLESKRMDRLGLELTRSIWRISRPFARPLPVRALVADECVAQGELLATVVVSLGIVPAVFAVLSAYVLRRKEEGL